MLPAKGIWLFTNEGVLMAIRGLKKFLCDQMCGELGRWLRTAGYDTIIASPGQPDQELLTIALQEDRHLLTKDQKFSEMDPNILYLHGETLEALAIELKDKLQVDWLFHPFSRCLECNTLLEKIPPPTDLPKQVLENAKQFWKCPSCQQAFWLGTHTERMRETLCSFEKDALITLGLGGDLMIGRLVDEHLNTAPPASIWGTLHPLLQKTDYNIVNLETTLTSSEEKIPKTFNFKASPEKIASLLAGPIHAVNLANNHILDFGEEGLRETLKTLDAEHILHVGAGENPEKASAPSIIECKGMKIGLLGCTDNEPTWKATSTQPGTYYLEVGDLEALRFSITTLRKEVDFLILSIHWGPNMRQRPAPEFQSFAHDLIDLGVDLIHGHSAHIYQGMEVYKNKLILYDTGDFVDDYAIDPLLRNDRSFFFQLQLHKGKWISLKMIPTIIEKFQVNISEDEEQIDLMETLCGELNTLPIREDHTLAVYPEG